MKKCHLVKSVYNPGVSNIKPLATSSVERQASEERKDKSERERKEGLSGRQIAARHVLGKEESIFSGDPEEWPLFLSTFEEAAKTCGFSSAENLIRLERCLKGNALELVKGQLRIKENVPDDRIVKDGLRKTEPADSFTVKQNS